MTAPTSEDGALATGPERSLKSMPEESTVAANFEDSNKPVHENEVVALRFVDCKESMLEDCTVTNSSKIPNDLGIDNNAVATKPEEFQVPRLEGDKVATESENSKDSTICTKVSDSEEPEKLQETTRLNVPSTENTVNPSEQGSTYTRLRGPRLIIIETW